MLCNVCHAAQICPNAKSPLTTPKLTALSGQQDRVNWGQRQGIELSILVLEPGHTWTSIRDAVPENEDAMSCRGATELDDMCNSVNQMLM
mmetsp:Transcript_58936/g.97743  ORF Transcript_58936/g.97743 Transcript_58936/m.97743 type:complete len:90 (+) Transcript_58936:317-586(+)